MTAASLNRTLAVLVAAAVATGALTLRAGTPDLAWVFALHALASGALAIAVVLKLRSSLPAAIARRRWRRLAVALVVTLATAGAIVGGYAWVAAPGLLSLERWTVLTIHAWAGLALAPLLLVHLLPRRWRLLRPVPSTVSSTLERVLTRRSLLVGLAFGAGALALTTAARAAEGIGGGQRRFTGSRLVARGGIPPATTFFVDREPPVDPGTWRLAIHGRVLEPASMTVTSLERTEAVDVLAVLDCTSGWAVETTWTGVRLATVLDAARVTPDAREVVVRSATGWTANLGLAEARRALLATRVAGVALPAANGAPCRLVVPTRRGLDWVKWVTEIEVR